MTYSERNAKAIATLHPVVAAMATALLADLESKGEDILITDATRTIAQQNALYAKGRTKPGAIVTYAKGTDSAHTHGVAFDFVPINKDGYPKYDDTKTYKRVIAIAKAHGFESGIDWEMRDLPHLQYLGGYPLSAFKSGKAQSLLKAPETALESSLFSFGSLSIAERIKRIQKALQRATGARLKSLQRALDRFIG